MAPSILIATVVGDLHAHAVALSLARRGVDAEIWYTSDFPADSTETYEVLDSGENLVLGGPGLALKNPEPDVVWNRRTTHEVPFERLAKPDALFAELQAEAFRKGFMGLLAPAAFWVNPWRAARTAKFKLRQLRAARAVQLKVPETLCTNDPSAIRAMLQRHGGEIIYKPLQSGVSWHNAETTWACYTSTIQEGDLVADELLAAVPGIYQEVIEKAFELRVTMIGERAFATKIDSQQTEKGKIDWRLAYDELTMVPFEMPSKWLAQCRALLEALGLVFGCIDFIVTTTGELIFLEINEQGQFLFNESYCDLPLLEAFTSFLSAGSPKYELREKNLVTFEEVREEAQAAADQSLDAHRQVQRRTVKEGMGGEV